MSTISGEDHLKAWVDELLPGTPPNSALGKALAYTTRQWPKLTRHLQHAEIPVDNNYIERQIKHYATGRKSWLFSYDAVGAQASANLFSLVMTARANDVEPYAYLNYLFEYLPAAEYRRADRSAAAVERHAGAVGRAPEKAGSAPVSHCAIRRHRRRGPLRRTWMLKCLPS